MKLQIAQSFERSLAKLDAETQPQVLKTLFKFLNHGTNLSGFNYERLNGNARVWHSIRVNRGIRIILTPNKGSHLIAYVGQHDPAYEWADRHRPSFETGNVLEIAEVRETVTEREIVQPTLVELPPLIDVSDGVLVRCGVPASMFDWVRQASEDALLDESNELSSTARLNLLELITGGSDDAFEVTDLYPSAYVTREQLEHLSELGSWPGWLVHLHDTQRNLARASYPGPVRFHGSAGTGKTITLLHRARHLLDEYGEHNVLVTTASLSVPELLETQISLLIPEEHEHNARLEVGFLQKVAMPFFQEARNYPFQYDPTKLSTIFSNAYNDHDSLPWPEAVLKAEFDMVIDPMGARTVREYLALDRVGRGTSLGQLARARIWPLFARVYEELEREQLSTYDDLYLTAARWLERHPDQRSFDHVLVDEAQDLSHSALLFIRALATPGPDDITLVGDVGQRTMGHKASWRGAGVELQGRSFQLDINFRTTEKVRVASESLLPLHLEGPDGELDMRAAKSLDPGTPLELFAASSPETEAREVERWLNDLTTSRGFAPESIALTYHSTRGEQLAREVLGMLSLTSRQRFQDEGVWLGHVRTIKGLEFDAVGVLDCSADQLPNVDAIDSIADPGDRQNAMDRELRHLYIALTRARHLLWISWSGEPSPLLDPIRRMVPARTTIDS